MFELQQKPQVAISTSRYNQSFAVFILFILVFFFFLWFHQLIGINQSNAKVRKDKTKNIKCKQNDLNKLHQWIDANPHLKIIIEIGQMLTYAHVDL